jgi:hypothetical protein
MAKTPAAPTATPDPITRISWSKEGGPKLTGPTEALALGKRARITLEGPITGFSMRDYGCDVELKPKTIHIESVKDGGGDDRLSDAIDGLKKGTKRSRGT